MQTGAVVGGRYRIERLAGAGGMGTVYRAIDERTGEPRAIKVLAPGATQRTRERFSSEAAVLAKVSHPAIVRYVDHGEEGSVPFLVMEWVDGESLAERIARSGTTPAEALRLGERLVGALAAAHAVGVVHRDVKPRNVMLPGGAFDASTSRRPAFGGFADAKIVDFGVARVQSDAGKTTTGMRIGTPRYMAPEQIVSSRRVDGRADVFSLGCVLFEMLTGRKAFRGNDEVALLARMVIEDAPRVRSVRADLPEEIDALVARMLARDHRHRPFADEALARDMRAALARLGDLGAAHAEPEGAGDGTADDTPAELMLDTGLEPLPPPSELPWETIGRDAELLALERVLAPGAVVSLWGAFGVGKSHLAQALARHLWQTRGALVCDLRGARDEAEIVRRVATEAGVLHAPSAMDVTASLAARGGPLVVLDACDGALDAAVAFARRIVDDAPSASVLVASRERARLRDTFELSPLDAASSALLLVARSRGAASLERDREALATIATALQGNALALTLAASRTSVLGVAAVAARSSRPLEVLGAALRDAAAEVWETLTPAERAGAIACAIFPSAIRPEIAESVCATSLGSDALDVLQALREKSILRAGPRATLVMDATLRELARAEPDDARANVELAFTRATIAAASEDLGELVAWEDDLLLAADLAIRTRDAELALRAALALEPSLTARGPLDRLADLLDRASELDGAPMALRARARAARGRTATLSRDFDIAKGALDDALAAARSLGDADLEASTWLDLGVMHQAMDAFSDAEHCYVTVLDLHEAVASRSEARARGNLGALAHDRGDLDTAYSHYVRAIAVAESIGDARLLGVFLSNLAVLDRERGHAGSARQRFVRALHAMGEARDRRLVGIALGNLGMLELEEGRVSAALVVFERSAEMLAALGDIYSAALAYARLAAALAMSGDAPSADAAIARGEKLAAHDERALAIVRFFRAFPEAIRARESGDAAAAFLERARARAASAASLAARSDDVRVALRLLAGLGVE